MNNKEVEVGVKVNIVNKEEAESKMKTLVELLSEVRRLMEEISHINLLELESSEDQSN